jgi:hypothetical protein
MKTTGNTAIALLFTLAIITMNACSYGVDLVERAITKRASFSIEATYNPTTNTITISWTESGGTNFAGYEVYMTEEADNEYSGYVVIGAPYSISSSPLFRVESSLQYVTTNTFTMNSTQVTALPSKGRYFFRVGIIDWDEDADKRTLENGYTGDTLHDYTNNTDIAEISGLAMVDI